ncbi:hypothetical protein DL96DRAFT_1554525 [Flagelloscypha sp. PMI_526]|nr:hypothetical protein DL96DRAFT_1554525 [Flagelloscypha sp. PMI_526]
MPPRKKNPVECFCVSHCGGPNGPGKTKSVSARNMHRKHDAAALLAQLPAVLATQSHSMSSEDQNTSKTRGRKRKRAGADLPESDSDAPMHSYSLRTLSRQEDPLEQVFQDYDGSMPQSGGSNFDVSMPEEPQNVDFEHQENSVPGEHCKTPPRHSVTIEDVPDEDDDTVPLPPLSQGSSLRNNDVLPLEESAGADEEAETYTPNFVPRLDDIKLTLEFIKLLENASLDSEIEPLPLGLRERLRNPPTEPLELTTAQRISLDFYLCDGSEDVYARECAAVERNLEVQCLSLDEVKSLVMDITGIIPIVRDMCEDVCIAYTGPFSSLEHCPFCGKARYKLKGKRRIPCKQFTTLPLGPWLQCLHRNPETSKLMGYRGDFIEELEREFRKGERTSSYRDFFDGSDFQEAYRSGKVGEHDIVVLHSMDGAQLYRNKTSDMQMSLWLVLDLAPDGRFKLLRVYPGTIIPGPNKPKHHDSFLFPSFYHVSALQREGLRIWKAVIALLVTASIFFALQCADGPGMATINGLTGHKGKIHCREFCPIIGRRKPQDKQYSPALSKPDGYSVDGCSHPDVDLFALLEKHTSATAADRYQRSLETVVNSKTKTSYEINRRENGIVKPTLLSGLDPKHTLPIPSMFAPDIMHLPNLNIPDLFFPLWRGQSRMLDSKDDIRTWSWACFINPNVWDAHGKDVDACGDYMPGSFDRKPRNPAEKLTSGYKAWEFLLYFYGLGPCLFWQHLPLAYYTHYCKLVRAIHICLQMEITPTEAEEALNLLCDFSEEYEELYVQRKTYRLHFVRPAIHALSHLAPDIARLGPAIIYSQWVMERLIGYLGGKVMQHSNPYANLTQRAIRMAQGNAIKAIDPTFEYGKNSDTLPKYAVPLGNGYSLRCAKDSCARDVSEVEAAAFRTFLRSNGVQISNTHKIRIRRWARVGLPNGQIARSRWKEEANGLKRTARNVTVCLGHETRFAEVHYYCKILVQDTEHHVAVASFYSTPHPELYANSFGTYISIHHNRDVDVRVIDIKSISSVVMVAPDPRYCLFYRDGTEENRFFAMSKPGLKVLNNLIGLVEQDEEEFAET